MSAPKWFPIMRESVFRKYPAEHVRRVPWDMLAPHEAQAKRNHDQSLERLAERGGLGAAEALAVLEDRPWRHLDEVEADSKLRELVKAFEAAEKATERTNGDGYDLNKWVPLHQRNMLAVARGEEEIYFLDAKVSGHSSVEALAKLLNDRAQLLAALKAIIASAEDAWRMGCFATLGAEDAERARAAIATAEGK